MFRSLFCLVYFRALHYYNTHLYHTLLMLKVMLPEDLSHRSSYHIRSFSVQLPCAMVRFQAYAETMTINIDCFQICENEGSFDMKITPFLLSSNDIHSPPRPVL